MLNLAENLTKWTDAELTHALKTVRLTSDYGKALTAEINRRKK